MIDHLAEQVAWLPAGEAVSVFTWKTSSVVSLVIVFDVGRHLVRQADERHLRLAVEVDRLVHLDDQVDLLALLDARGLVRASATNGAAIVSLASCDETKIGPLGDARRSR